MPIPIKRIPIQLQKATPSLLTAEDLKKQLDNAGLKCSDTAEKKLGEYIKQVRKQIRNGAIQSFGINQALGSAAKPIAEANWKPKGDSYYATDLLLVQYPEHFEYLYKNKKTFLGKKKDAPEHKGDYTTIDAVKTLFSNVTTDASASLISGLDKSAMEAAMKNAISSVDETAKDYDSTDSRVIYLVDNYDEDREVADGIGVLTVGWHLTIKDYKKKPSDPKEDTKHRTTLTVSTRSVLYSDLKDLNEDVAMIHAHYKENIFLPEAIPMPATTVKIFDRRPAACEATYRQSLAKISKEGYADVIVFYSPNLQNIGVLDNSNSKVESSYSKSVTTGFTFSSTQTLSEESSAEASIEIVKAGCKSAWSISFTEQVTVTQTETITFTVPPGEKAFTYQGYLYSEILRFDGGTGRYTYHDKAKFVTNIVTTSTNALTGEVEIVQT